MDVNDAMTPRTVLSACACIILLVKCTWQPPAEFLVYYQDLMGCKDCEEGATRSYEIIVAGTTGVYLVFLFKSYGVELYTNLAMAPDREQYYYNQALIYGEVIGERLLKCLLMLMYQPNTFICTVTLLCLLQHFKIIMGWMTNCIQDEGPWSHSRIFLLATLVTGLVAIGSITDFIIFVLSSKLTDIFVS